jgi:aerobic-type carbon monoxide dehydrogenase small subunit (CoxS/CutS family)
MSLSAAIAQRAVLQPRGRVRVRLRHRLCVVRIELDVNGERHELEVDPTRRLSSVLRDDLGLTGTKLGCGEGACGACAVLLDGRAVNSCLVLAGSAEGRSVVTIEGISADGLTPLQQAFLEEDALQCGFCTPGQIVAGTALLAEHPHPTREQIRAGMSGNLCRCGAYPKIELAVLRAAEGGA